MLKVYFADETKITQKSFTTLSNIVNEAYAIGEKGMWNTNAERTTAQELRNKARNKQLIIAEYNNKLVGSVVVNILEEKNTAEFGMLAVQFENRNKGIGYQLIQKAEEWAKTKGSKYMRLELLTPCNWKHPDKEILKDWYKKLGYLPQYKESLDKAHKNLIPHLITECDFTIYTKTLTT